MIRFHGSAPFRIAVVHGGPGGIGSAAPLAEGILHFCGESVAEPLQSEYSVRELTEELCSQIRDSRLEKPLVLIGHSWGAWLAAFAAQRMPEQIRRLILIGCPPLRKQENVDALRLSRLSESGRRHFHELTRDLESAEKTERDKILNALGNLCAKADCFQRAEGIPEEAGQCDGEMFFRVWPEAEKMREDGTVEHCFRMLNVPISIFHGDYDPHPADGIRPIFEKNGKECVFHLLERCGHTPWEEKYAQEIFFRLLGEELRK